MSDKSSIKEQKPIWIKELTKKIKEAPSTKAVLELLKKTTKQLQKSSKSPER
ncbi:hypothetical protein [Candidatus Phycorickettsia trachydisci]|uniref:hypothetical protein n=1 Tax=Candidatus Phycorickettsia trachydisci TaxID=2115978 RepID=UPI00131A4F8D|nr:hypothetical protein [Candidatus Phycorickettsia trachydisci]